MSIRTTTEQTFYTNLSKLVKGHWTRIENSAHPGTPDTHFCGLYREGNGDEKVHPVEAFIELKVLHNTPKYDAPLNIRFERGQLPWLVQHSLNYGVGIVAIRFDRPAHRYHEVLLVRASPALPEILSMDYSSLIVQPCTLTQRMLNLGEGLPQFIYKTNNEYKPRRVRKEQRRFLVIEGEE